jgi:hypothetical protein
MSNVFYHPQISTGLITDPPRVGECKLRVKTDGTEPGTTVVAVDANGGELEVLGVVAVSWALTGGELPRGTVTVDGTLEFRPFAPRGRS